MKHLVLFFALFITSLTIAQDHDVQNAIDSINHELDSNYIFSVDRDKNLVIQDLEIKTNYTFFLKKIDISQELQFTYLCLKFTCSNGNTCFMYGACLKTHC